MQSAFSATFYVTIACELLRIFGVIVKTKSNGPSANENGSPSACGIFKRDRSQTLGYIGVVLLNVFHSGGMKLSAEKFEIKVFLSFNQNKRNDKQKGLR